MSTLVVERRRPLENDDNQGSLFGDDAFAPAPLRMPASWESPPADAAPPALDATPPTEPGAAANVSPPQAIDAPTASAAPAGAPIRPAAEELIALEQAVGDAVRASRAPVSGPTLDDVMSRAWEGLATGMPAACPVCHGEVVPASHGPLQGRCTSCGTTID
ncbi:MAG TPA: hypothetical protein VNS09_11535 [Solirubrobacter sp.]|nr:hypothetical protein [Solirubrobacter sp.]